jgi:hypothetical protein
MKAKPAAKRLWQFHSRSQCMSCHSTWSEFALAFRPEQLNRPGPDGRNQLVALSGAGLIRRAGRDGASLPPFDAGSVARERRLVPRSRRALRRPPGTLESGTSWANPPRQPPLERCRLRPVSLTQNRRVGPDAAATPGSVPASSYDLIIRNGHVRGAMFVLTCARCHSA